MKKTRKIKAPVSERALLARINRALADEGRMIKKCRADSRWYTDLGDYYEIDFNRHLTGKHIDLEELGRSVGVLKEWEELR